MWIVWTVMCADSIIAQWAFLGPQWLRPDSVSGHAICLNHHRQVHVASASGGAVHVQRFDGTDWLDLGTGLPMADQVACDLTMDDEDEPLLVTAPRLSLYAFDNGHWNVEGLPAVPAALAPRILVSADDVRWLLWWQAGIVDSTFVLRDSASSGWQVAGAFAGRLNDVALNEAGRPMVLLRGAPALRYYAQGAWLSLPNFYHADQEYIALAPALDGTGTGVAALRRDSSDHLSVELLSNGVWTQLGATGFASGDLVDLALSPSGVFHVLSEAHATQGLPQVHRFIAGTWQLLGGQYVYNNAVSAPLLAFDMGAAFVLFQDDEQGFRNSVMYLGNPVATDGMPDTVLGDLYPNPAIDIVHLRLPAAASGSVLHLSDAFGREIGHWDMAGQSQMELAVGHLPAGRYWLSLQHRHGAPSIGTFLKIN